MGKPLETLQRCHFRVQVSQSCHGRDSQGRCFQVMGIQRSILGQLLDEASDWRMLDLFGGLQMWNRVSGRSEQRHCFLHSHIWIQWLRQGPKYHNESTSSSCGLWPARGQDFRRQDGVANQQQRL